jgi:hypothetical protein
MIAPDQRDIIWENTLVNLITTLPGMAWAWTARTLNDGEVAAFGEWLSAHGATTMVAYFNPSSYFPWCCMSLQKLID